MEGFGRDGRRHAPPDLCGFCAGPTVRDRP